MLWAMMRFYLLSIALVFCGYTNGFNVWNRTSILDWQAGRSNVTWSQNFQLATPDQLLELPSRKGPNGNDGRGNFGNPVLTSEVQPAQRDSSFVQSSGGVAQIKQILNAYGQTAPSHQPNDAPQPSQLYWNEFIKPGKCGPLPSQHWPAKNLPGFQSPSSSQPAGTINQVSEYLAQSPYQPNSTPVSADLMSSSLAQSSGALTWFQNASSSGYLTSQSIPSSPQSVVTTNQISESQTQLPYQSSSTGTTISVSTSQSDSTAQPQGSNRTKSSETAKWYRVLQGKMIPSSSKVLGFQTPLYQPSLPTQFSAGQSASTFQAQGTSASTPFQGQALSWHVSQDQSIPSSQAVVTTNPTQSSYQPSLPTQALAGQSAISQEQPLQVSAAYPLQASGWYTISQGWKIPSSSQVSGFQAQSYQPGTPTQVLLGQPASPVQSMGNSTLYQALTSGRYLASPGLSIPSSSQSVIATGQISAQVQSSQPSTTTQALAGQSISQDQSLQASAAYPLQTSGWYTTSQGQKIPSSSQVSGFQAQSIQPSTTTQVLSGQSVAQTTASNVSQTSGWYTILLGKMIPSSQVSGVQTGLLIPSSSTQVLPGPSVSTAPLQPLGASTPYQMQGSSRYISQNQSNPLFSQAVVTTNQISGIKSQTPYWANTTWTTANQSQSQGSYMTESSGNAKWYSVVQGQIMPSSSGLQVQSFQPSTATQVLPGQSAASPVQSMGGSKLYQALTSGRYLTSLGQNIPPSLQAVATANQTSGFQNIYWPNTPVSTSQSVFLPQSSSASQLFQGQTSGMSSISQDQSIPSSSQSVNPSSQITPSQTQSSFQPSTTTQVLTGQSAIAQNISLQASYPPQTSGWYTILQGQIPSPSQVSGFQAQSSYQPSSTTQVTPGQSVSSQSMGASALYQALSSGRYPSSLGQNIPPSPQPVAPTNQISGFQNTYWSSTPVSTSQTVFLPQSSSASQLCQGQTSGMSSISQDQSIPPSSQSVNPSSQIAPSQTQSSLQPSTTTQVLTGQSALSSQPIGASSLYQALTSGRYLAPLGQSIPSSSQSVNTSSQITPSQTQSSLQPSTTTQVLTGQSALAPAQSLRNSALCSSQTPSWYTTLQGKLISSSQMSGFQTALQQPSTTSQSAASSHAQYMRDSPLYQGLTSYSNLTSQYQRTPSSFQSVAALNQISGIQNQSIYWPNTIQLAPSQSAFTSQSQSSGVATMFQVPAKGLPNISQDQSITASLQSVPSANQISGFQNQTSYWPSTTQVLPGDSHIAQIQSLGNSVSYPSQTSGWYPFVQSKIPSSQVSGFLAPSYQPSTKILAGQSDSVALLSSSGPMLYQGQALSRYNISQDQSFPSSSLSVATTNQISGAPSQSSFQPNSTVASTSQAQSSGASAWYQGPTFGFLTSQSQNIPSSSQSVVPANQFFRFQNLIQSNAAQVLSQSASTAQGAPQKIAGIPFQGSLPHLVSKKWPVTQ